MTRRRLFRYLFMLCFVWFLFVLCFGGETVKGAKIPMILYGTAWKGDDTTQFVRQAIENGFVGIDTAAQPKHYREELVGKGIQQMIYEEHITRDQLFIQTKFTPLSGQDPQNLPYDPTVSLEQQVYQSFDKSLRNLQTHYIDSLLLHSPLDTHSRTREVWQAMERLHDTGKVLQLGISNVYDLQTLVQLWEDSRIKPTMVQNRFYKTSNYDREIRTFCVEKGITYQSFWSLTANRHILQSSVVQHLAKKHSKTAEQIFLRFLMGLGIVPLSGTRNPVHMKQDIETTNTFELRAGEMMLIEEQLYASEG
eukprot:TRINITY_DN2976_c0_g1_i4.p1 TRINITY_DN2976_c0_g1~~TRINITY_DN2976_c0_g1_i4.p1  ORF type:complete len:308 (-),score=42.65 TRINITY_DN2976_c0_g1_i4:326-1249(-)